MSRQRECNRIKSAKYRASNSSGGGGGGITTEGSSSGPGGTPPSAPAVGGGGGAAAADIASEDPSPDLEESSSSAAVAVAAFFAASADAAISAAAAAAVTEQVNRKIIESLDPMGPVGRPQHGDDAARLFQAFVEAGVPLGLGGKAGPGRPPEQAVWYTAQLRRLPGRDPLNRVSRPRKTIEILARGFYKLGPDELTEAMQRAPYLLVSGGASFRLRDGAGASPFFLAFWDVAARKPWWGMVRFEPCSLVEEGESQEMMAESQAQLFYEVVAYALRYPLERVLCALGDETAAAAASSAAPPAAFSVSPGEGGGGEEGRGGGCFVRLLQRKLMGEDTVTAGGCVGRRGGGGVGGGGVVGGRACAGVGVGDGVR